MLPAQPREGILKGQVLVDNTTSNLLASVATSSVRLSQKLSLFRRAGMDDVVTVTPILLPTEGDVIAVKVLSTLNRWAMVRCSSGCPSKVAFLLGL